MEHENIGNNEDMSKYRLEQAKDDLDTAKLLIEAEKYKAANNRAYYACYHAINSILAIEQVAFKRHKDTLAYFNKNYVHTGEFPNDIGHRISRLQMIRHKSDYDTFYVASKEVTQQQIQTAEDVIRLVEDYLYRRTNH